MLQSPLSLRGKLKKKNSKGDCCATHFNFSPAQRDIINMLAYPEFRLVKPENRVFFLDINLIC